MSIPAAERFTDAVLAAEEAAAAGRADEDGVRAAVERERLAFHRELAGDGVLAAVATNARLDAAACEVLGLLLAVELDAGRQALVRRLTSTTGATGHLALGLLRRLFGDGSAGLAAVAPDGALVRACLVTVPGDGPWAQRPVRLAASVLWAATGDDSVEPAVPPTARWLDAPEAGTPGTGGRLVLVVGADPVRRLQVAISSAAGERFLVTPPPADEATWEGVVREATLTGRGVVVELDDDLPAAGRRWVERADHLVWALVSRVELPVDQLPRRAWIEVRADTSVATPDEVAEAFGPGAEVAHRLTAHQVEQAGRVLAAGRLAHSEAGATVPADEITAAVRRLASGELDRLAVRIRPRRRWDELVLPDEQLGMVRDVVDRYRHRSQVYGGWGFAPVPSAGVVAMFAGPPGTGKTLSAEIIAGELGLDLFRIDLAALVSKYVGETEKNLEKVFRAAEGGTMVLLFDEADAVFGKRSEVSDANDRYANVETSYLLQRLETYDGVVVLTTNYASNIDEAFLRRIHVAVEFGQPDEAERRRLWERCFPADAPVVGLDLDFLAGRFTLTGASIRSVALAAAFRAAAASGTIGMPEVLGALRAELRKQGRLTGPADFAPYDTVPGPVAVPVGAARSRAVRSR